MIIMGRNTKIVGGVVLAAALGLGYVGVDRKIEEVKSERANHALELKENGLFSSASYEFENGYLDFAKANYDSAQAVFPDSDLNLDLGNRITSALVERDSLRLVAILEERKTQRENEMRADFGPVNPRSGLTEYNVKPEENLWTATGYFMDVQNFDRVDERKTFEPWSQSYDLLVKEGKNPDSLEVGNSVSFKVTEEQREQAQLDFEKYLLNEATGVLRSDRESINSLRTEIGNNATSIYVGIINGPMADLKKELDGTLLDIQKFSEVAVRERIYGIEFLDENYDSSLNDGVTRLREMADSLVALDLRNQEINGLLQNGDLEGLIERLLSLGADAELNGKFEDASELRMERQEKVAFDDTFKAHADGRFEDALISLDKAVELHRKREATGFLEKEPAFYDTYAGLRSTIANKIEPISWSSVKSLF